ncbi:hypothetical protein QQ056_09385 [Oscillatoria laete-virens NRMC-F 0139]|nr:hypothetical protein [Oscillatoria laete-virens]MDL5053755.1 hypothetical protein [Oscillatoria laete-virens NRMC-F 0139]
MPESLPIWFNLGTVIIPNAPKWESFGLYSVNTGTLRISFSDYYGNPIEERQWTHILLRRRWMSLAPQAVERAIKVYPTRSPQIIFYPVPASEALLSLSLAKFEMRIAWQKYSKWDYESKYRVTLEEI